MNESATPAASVPSDAGTTIRKRTMVDFLRDEPRALAIVAAFFASLLLNAANVVPFLGPLIDFVGDAGVEAIALVLAGSLLRRDGRPLKGLLVLGGLGLLKTALDGLNLLPEIGSLMEIATELGLDLTQVWFLKELLTRPAAPPMRDITPRTPALASDRRP